MDLLVVLARGDRVHVVCPADPGRTRCGLALVDADRLVGGASYPDGRPCPNCARADRIWEHGTPWERRTG